MEFIFINFINFEFPVTIDLSKSLLVVSNSTATDKEREGERMSTQLAEEYMASSHLAEEGPKKTAVSAMPLFGTWKNINRATRDLVKTVITGTITGIAVETFGAYAPSPCKWGSVMGLAYASSVNVSPAVAFTAQYTFSFAHIILIGYLHGPELLVETFTQFTDGSGRSNLYTSDTLIK